MFKCREWAFENVLKMCPKEAAHVQHLHHHHAQILTTTVSCQMYCIHAYNADFCECVLKKISWN